SSSATALVWTTMAQKRVAPARKWIFMATPGGMVCHSGRERKRTPPLASLQVERNVQRARMPVAVVARGDTQQVVSGLEHHRDANWNAVLHHLLVGFAAQVRLRRLRFQMFQLAFRSERSHLEFKVCAEGKLRPSAKR